MMTVYTCVARDTIPTSARGNRALRRASRKLRSVSCRKRSIEEVREDPDLKRIVFNYQAWVSENTWAVFNDNGGQVHQFLSPKRGNEPYMRRVDRGFYGLNDLINTVSYCPEYTGLLFVTLTMDPAKILRPDSWHKIGQFYNSFITNMRKTFKTAFHPIRCFETQRNGYPHIHALIWTPSKMWDVYKREGTYRLKDVGLLQKIKNKWKHGYSDIQACISGRYAFNYILKYIKDKSARDEPIKHSVFSRRILRPVLNYAMQWNYKKRSYAVGRYYRDLIRIRLLNSKPGVPSGVGSFTFIGINSLSNGFIPKELFHRRGKLKKSAEKWIDRITAAQKAVENANVIKKLGLQYWVGPIK